MRAPRIRRGAAARGVVACAVVRAVAWVLAGLVVAWTAQPALADSLRGSRALGTVGIPTADSGPRGEFTAGLHLAGGGPVYSYLRYQLTGDLELGAVVSAFGPADPSQTHGVGLLAHYQFLEEDSVFPALAVGIEGLDGYVVASRHLEGPRILRAHLGARTGQHAGLFAGLSAILNPVTVRRPGAFPVPVVSVGLDYDGVTLNAGTTLAWGSAVQFDLGVMDKGGLTVAAGLNISTGF